MCHLEAGGGRPPEHSTGKGTTARSSLLHLHTLHSRDGRVGQEWPRRSSWRPPPSRGCSRGGCGFSSTSQSAWVWMLPVHSVSIPKEESVSSAHSAHVSLSDQQQTCSCPEPTPLAGRAHSPTGLTTPCAPLSSLCLFLFHNSPRGDSRITFFKIRGICLVSAFLSSAGDVCGQSPLVKCKGRVTNFHPATVSPADETE